MKRKLDANDVPSAKAPEEPKSDATESSFEDLRLDPRLRQALIQEKFSKPTLVQAKAIPLALEGKDILGKYLFSLEKRQEVNGDSPRKDRVWKDRCLCTTDIADDSAEENCSSNPLVHLMFVY